MTLLLPRAKSSQYLTCLLCALLACPTNLPTLDRDDARADREILASASSLDGPRPRLHRPDRKSCHDHEPTDWSVVADEPEAALGRDDVRFAPLTPPDRPLDLPSLVPASLDPRPLGPGRPVAPPSFRPPLRC